MSLVNSLIFFGALLFGGAVAKIFRVRVPGGVGGAAILASLAIQFAFTVGLLVPKFAWTNYVLGGVVCVGVCEFFRTGSWRRLSVRKVDYFGLLLAGGLFAAFSLHYVSAPLYFWDARSIWFFHAKILFYGEKMLSPEMWNHTSLSWSHAHYPKLNAFLAAEVMRFFGYWNEYLPKLSLAILTLPAVLFAVGYSRSLEVRLLLVVGLIMRQGVGLTGGYMDGFVAIYAGVAALYAGRFALCRSHTDFMAAVAAMGILSGLKQEGVFIAAAIVGATGLAMVTAWGYRAAVRGAFNCLRSHVAFIALVCAPYVIWSVFKSVGGLHDYFLGQGSVAERIASRASDGSSISHVLTTIQVTFLDWTSILILSVIGLFIVYSREGFGRRFTALAPGLVGAVLYTAILLLVYLSTPFDMNWHVASSVDRTVTALKAMVFGGFVAFVDASAYWQGKVSVLPENEDELEVGRLTVGGS